MLLCDADSLKLLFLKKKNLTARAHAFLQKYGPFFQRVSEIEVLSKVI